MSERSRLSTRRLPSTRLTASRGEMAGKAAPDSIAAASTLRTSAGEARGRAASCTSTKSHSPSAAIPARTDAWRLSPPGLTRTGLLGCSAATSCSAVSRRAGGPTTTILPTSSSERKSSRTRARVVRPLSLTSALLPRPRREPEPAAATIAPTDGIRGSEPHSSWRLRAPARRPSCPSRWANIIRPDEVGVDLGARSGLVVDHLEGDGGLLLHLGKDVEPPAPAPAAHGVGGVRHQLQLTQDGTQDDEWHIDKTGLGNVEDAAVDDDRCVEQHLGQLMAARFDSTPEEDRSELGPPGDSDRGAERGEQQGENG